MPWDASPHQDRFDPLPNEKTMKAVVTAGNGGFEQLQCRVVKRPQPRAGEVLIKVLAAGMNNTEINTRIGWYSDAVSGSTAEIAVAGSGSIQADGGWNATTPFPFIQGTDCFGEVVEVGTGGNKELLGKRVLVRACMRPHGFDSMENIWMGSDFDGAFAQFVRVPQTEVFPVKCDWRYAELATIPCAYGTAENMIQRAGIQDGERVLITGASGGVGSAAIQFVKLRGAEVIALVSSTKQAQILELGAKEVVERNQNLIEAIGEESIDVVVDIVAGEVFPSLLKVLKRGGRYVSAGAIGGPLVSFDTRTFYLKDLQLIGCTAWDEPVFPSLISYIEKHQIKPLLAKTFPLEMIAKAQQEFLLKKHVGNFVLIPPD
ncbi:MAG: alcohol dehydrogenase family protein [SAR324 cluster bacterium]|nr:alcohol dehydrogenase family protein [SAR324 cluster bacterium]